MELLGTVWLCLGTPILPCFYWVASNRDHAIFHLKCQCLLRTLDRTIEKTSFGLTHLRLRLFLISNSISPETWLTSVIITLIMANYCPLLHQHESKIRECSLLIGPSFPNTTVILFLTSLCSISNNFAPAKTGVVY